MMRTSGSFAGKRVDRENECCYNNKAIYEPLAQSVEHLTFNQGVRDSNSRGRTKKHQTVLTLSGAFLCCLSADSVHRAEIREPLRCFLLCKVQVFLHLGQACVAQNFPQAVYITAVFQVACSKRMSQQVRV